MSEPITTRGSVRKRLLLVGVVVAAVYALSSGAMLLRPSPHFHFTDMAWNLMHGRIDTDTPRRWANQPPRADDPPGLHDAIQRHLVGPDGKAGGWNDWASYRVLTLKGGQVVRGVFPWKDQPGPRAKEFHTLDGKLMIIDVDKELKTGCDAARPAERCDRVVYQVSFPPLPALLMMPLVLLQGYRANDVIVTLLFAVLSAVLFAAWLERLARPVELGGRGLIHTTARDRLWLVALMALGTVTWYCSIRGSVWFTALVIGLTLHLAYLWFAEGARRPFWAGLCFGLGVATRTPLLFAGLFLPLEALFPDGEAAWRRRGGMAKALGQIAWFALPAAAIGAGLAWFNWIRWENPTEFGHLYLLEGTRGPTREHGLFNTVFLNNNLAAAVTNMPRLLATAPFVMVTRHGLGLLASSPALLALLGGPRLVADAPRDDLTERRRRGLARNLGWTLAAVVVPGLVYQNDGWQQFAYRFSMDFMPLLLGIFALRVQHLSRGVKALIVLSIVVQAFGAVTFGRMEQFYYD
jgi:hypothetical protein